MIAVRAAVPLVGVLLLGCSLDAAGLVEGMGGAGGALATASGPSATTSVGGGGSTSTNGTGGTNGAGGTGGAGGASSSSGAMTGASTSTGAPIDPCVDGCVLANAGGCNEFISSNDCQGCCAKIKQVAQDVGCAAKLQAFLDCVAMQLTPDVDVCSVSTCDSAGSSVTSCFKSACGLETGTPNFACGPLLGCVPLE